MDKTRAAFPLKVQSALGRGQGGSGRGLHSGKRGRSPLGSVVRADCAKCNVASWTGSGNQTVDIIGNVGKSEWGLYHTTCSC